MSALGSSESINVSKLNLAVGPKAVLTMFPLDSCGSMLAFHTAGPDSIPGRDKFPG